MKFDRRVAGGVCVAAMFALAMPAAAFAQAFSNGSFENGADPGLSQELSSGSTAISGWNVTSGSVDYINGYWMASNGSRSVDLAGSSIGSLSQTFDTLASQSYLVTFDLSKNPFGGAVPRLLQVSAGAFTQTYGFAAANSPADMMWAAQSFAFTATSAATTLTFAALNDGPYGPALDNVAVSQVGGTIGAVPELSTWAMMIAGFGVVGGAMRRRRVGTRLTFA